MMKTHVQIQTRNVRIKGWVAILTALALFLAIGAALAILAIGLFLFVFPLMVAASAVYYFLPKRKDPHQRGPARQPEIIEGEYRVLDARGEDQKPTK